jgi:hypothetical protein
MLCSAQRTHWHQSHTLSYIYLVILVNSVWPCVLCSFFMTHVQNPVASWWPYVVACPTRQRFYSVNRLTTLTQSVWPFDRPRACCGCCGLELWSPPNAMDVAKRLDFDPTDTLSRDVAHAAALADLQRCVRIAYCMLLHACYTRSSSAVKHTHKLKHRWQPRAQARAALPHACLQVFCGAADRRQLKTGAAA